MTSEIELKRKELERNVQKEREHPNHCKECQKNQSICDENYDNMIALSYEIKGFNLGVEMGKAEASKDKFSMAKKQYEQGKQDAQKEFLDKLEWLKLQFSNTDEDYDDQLFTGRFVKEKIDKFKQSIEGEKHED